MPWNKPGNSSDPNDPWKRKPTSDNPVDSAVEAFKKNFGNGAGGNKGLISLVLLGLLFIFLWSSYIQLGPKEKGVVLKFGEYSETIGAGPHFFPKFIYDVTVVDVEQTRNRKSSANMLTKNQNVVDIDLDVEYRVSNPEDFVLRVSQPEQLLKNAVESSLRHVVGSLTLDEAILEKRESIAFDVKPRLQEYLDSYNSGIYILQVKVTEVQPPDAVKGAYEDVNRALKNKGEVVNKARQHANKVIPEAEGIKQKRIEEAEAYKASRVEEAKGEASRFESLLVEYVRAPKVTRDRLYLETQERILQNSTKVFIDDGNGDQMIFLPLDKMKSSQSSSYRPSTTTPSSQLVQERAVQSAAERLKNR